MAGMLFCSMVTLCAELHMLNPSQAIIERLGKQCKCVLAFTLKLGALNRHDTNLDIRLKISFIVVVVD